MQAELIVLDSHDQVAAAIDPVRSRILRHLRDPDSAAGVARALDLPRQRVGYHVRALEGAGLLTAVGERKQRNCVERLLQATARRYVVSPSILSEGEPVSRGLRDRFSSELLVAAAARVVEEVGALQQSARTSGKRLPALTIDADVRFASPEASHAFARELARAVADLVAEYDDADAPHGRRFHMVAGAYASGEPQPAKSAVVR